MGKTILCEKVIGLENIVEVSGADFDEKTDFGSLQLQKWVWHMRDSSSRKKLFQKRKINIQRKKFMLLQKIK